MWPLFRKDGRIRVYDPRQGNVPIIEDANIVPKKGARILWAMDRKFLIVTRFSRCGEEMKYKARMESSKFYLKGDPEGLITWTGNVPPSCLSHHTSQGTPLIKSTKPRS